MRTGLRFRVLVAAVLCVFLSACGEVASRYHEPAVGELSASPWQEADQLFRRDDRWLGGDGAYTVDLGGGRVLWLFGDSFVGRGYSRDRRGATLVRNTVAIQRGYNPAEASAAFYWNTREGRAEAFFQSKGPSWYWPGSGVMAQGRLLVFLMEIETADNGFGFAPSGWSAVLVREPGKEPSRWEPGQVRLPEKDFGVVIGSAGSLVLDGYLHAFGTHPASHDAYLVRWRLSDAARGDLTRPQWWNGVAGWVDQDRLFSRPYPVFEGAQMEFTVHYEASIGAFLAVQTGSLSRGCLAYRTARSITGPWSQKTDFFCPGGEDRSGLLFYAGKAHPCLKGADLVCTYAVNSLDMDRIMSSLDLYYPVFVRVETARSP